MKKYAFAILALVAVVAGVGFVFAQKRGERGSGQRPPFGPPPFALEKIAGELNLSDEQRTQVKQILETEKTQIQILMETARRTHEQLKNLGTDGTYNEAQVAELANQQAETTRRLIIEKEKTKAAIFAVLTPEQRTQAAAMKDEFEGKMRGRFGGRGRHGSRGQGVDSTPNF
jgi:periplasmic protein CpxP/Spy